MTIHSPGSIRMSFIWPVLALLVAGCSTREKLTVHQPETVPAGQVQSEPEVKHKDLQMDVQESQEPPATTQFVHTVQWPGETLSLIAKWYTGEYANWKRVAKANPNFNPNRIYKGNKIVIPEEILNTRKPMPKDFVTRLTPRTKKANVQSKYDTPAKHDKPLPLFGPRGNPGH